MADAVDVKLQETLAKKGVSYAKEVAEQAAFAASGKLEGAIENLLQLEKTSRLVRPRARLQLRGPRRLPHTALYNLPSSCRLCRCQR